MTCLVAVGLNHRSATVELRERAAIAEDERAGLLELLHTEAGFREVMLISTCNRVEVYGVSPEGTAAGGKALEILARSRSIPLDQMREASFVRDSVDAARHIFRVAASLDSIVIGEPQILGQVKSSYSHAKDHGRVGPVLDRCLSLAFKGAKRVRTETEIGRGGASVSSVAVDLAGSIFGELRDSAVLVVGAGEMAEAAAVHLRAAGAPEIVVVNRSVDRGQALADKVEGRYEGWDKLAAELSRADVVVSSTGSRMPIIDRALLKPVMKKRRHRPLFLVDIAVPRDVSPDIARMDHVFLYNVDDLQSIVHDNLRTRQGEARLAETLVEQEIDGFVSWMRSRAVGPLIGRLQARGRGIVEGEVERALSRLPELGDAERKVVRKMGQAIMQKLLHAPMSTVRAQTAGPDGAALADALTALFGLEDPPESSMRDGASEQTLAPSKAAAAARPEPSS